MPRLNAQVYHGHFVLTADRTVVVLTPDLTELYRGEGASALGSAIAVAKQQNRVDKAAAMLSDAQVQPEQTADVTPEPEQPADA